MLLTVFKTGHTKNAQTVRRKTKFLIVYVENKGFYKSLTNKIMTMLE